MESRNWEDVVTYSHSDPGAGQCVLSQIETVFVRGGLSDRLVDIVNNYSSMQIDTRHSMGLEATPM